ncbi:MAG: Mediator of RNA polymerase II transcription subunit 18 [Ramalina farinacea]|uniref:Mediator of RNA polymerase II transcription subunit 18 n=1 Tax=Ramalina farinacea TaxID=258253 RepID=A0AA43TT10_9LECA|nr:Mediator of RNA polymerase II transcription subunit 18 [Ramalina farinacea]
MQPAPVLEKHLVFKPIVTGQGDGKGAAAGKTGMQTVEQKKLQETAKGDLFYVQIIGDGKTKEGNNDAAKWSIQFRDLPEVVQKRPVTSRLVADIPIVDSDPITAMAGLGYSYKSSYYLTGHRFTHLNTSLLLIKAVMPQTGESPEHVSDSEDVVNGQLVDPSGSYLIQASIRVQDGSKVELMNRATAELMNLKETLKGVVDLEVGDRLAMDTRVR